VWTRSIESALKYGAVHTVKVKGVGEQALKASEGENAWFETLLNVTLGVRG